MKMWKKLAKSLSALSNAAERVWIIEPLETRAMAQAGANLIEGWDIQLWWSGYGSGWTALQRERVASNDWATLELTPGGTGTFTDATVGSDPNVGLSPGLTYSYRLVNSTGGTQDLGTYTTARYGDTDFNGTVDDTDFNTWLDGYFNGGSTWSQGDFANDGTVDADNDWNIFLDAYNEGDAAPTTSVHGDAGVGTGTPYTLDFSYDSTINPSDYWIVNWGDGSSPQVLPGFARSAQHSFGAAGDFNVSVGVAAAGSRDLSGGTFSAGSHTVHVQGAAAAPSGVAVTSTTEGSVSVGWTNNASNANAVIMNVTKSGSAFGTYTLPATQNTFTLSGLDQNTSYGFSVAAQNYAGTSSATTAVTQQTNPAAPTSVTATPDGSGHLVVHWTDNTGGAVGHVVTGDNGSGVSTTLATLSAGTTSATIAVPPSGSTVPITVHAERSSPGFGGSGASSASTTATTVDQPQPFGVAPGTWDYAGANPSHLQNTTVTGNLHDIPTHNNLDIQWEPFDVDPGFTSTDTTTRTITISVGGTTVGTASYIYDSMNSDGTANYHETDSFPAGLGTDNGGADYVTSVAHTSGTATVTFTGAHFGTSGFWTLNSPVAVWSRPSVQISATKSDGTELTAGQNYVEFKVTRDGNLTNSLVVNLETPTGTATSGSDYSSIPTSVTIDAGTDTKVVQVPITDDTLAEGPETIKLAIKPSSGNVYALGAFVHTTLTIHDNPSVASIAIDVDPPGAGQNLVSGFNFGAKITVKGEALNETGLEMQVFAQTTMFDGAGVAMTASEIASYTGIDPNLLNTTLIAPSGTRPDAPGYGIGGYPTVDGTHEGTGTSLDSESFHEDSTGFPGVTADYWANIVDLTRSYTIKIFANGNNTTPIATKDWGYSWTNRAAQYQTGQQPAPPFNTGAVSYNNNNKGTFYNIIAINGLAALN